MSNLNDREYKSHPSYGLIRFSRRHGQDVFFGSNLVHHEYIALEVTRGEVCRDLHTDWYSNGERLIELRMTSTQFAELLTQMNCGTGIPCTLEHVVGQPKPGKPPVETLGEILHKEVKDSISGELKERLKNIKEAVADAKLSKKDEKSLLSSVAMLEQHLYLNIPFLMECAQERIVGMVSEAKNTIEAFWQGFITRIGLKAISDKKMEEVLQIPEGREEHVVEDLHQSEGTGSFVAKDLEGK